MSLLELHVKSHWATDTCHDTSLDTYLQYLYCHLSFLREESSYSKLLPKTEYLWIQFNWSCIGLLLYSILYGGSLLRVAFSREILMKKWQTLYQPSFLFCFVDLDTLKIFCWKSFKTQQNWRKKKKSIWLSVLLNYIKLHCRSFLS